MGAVCAYARVAFKISGLMVRYWADSIKRKVLSAIDTHQTLFLKDGTLLVQYEVHDKKYWLALCPPMDEARKKKRGRIAKVTFGLEDPVEYTKEILQLAGPFSDFHNQKISPRTILGVLRMMKQVDDKNEDNDQKSRMTFYHFDTDFNLKVTSFAWDEVISL